MLHSSHKYEEAMHGLNEHGVQLDGVKLNLAQMLKRKTEIVDSLCKGIEGLFLKNKITYFKGLGSFVNSSEIKITSDKNEEIIKAKNIIIATGSEVMNLPGIDIDEKKIVSSTGALELISVPKEMVVIGGGYIGLEMGSVWSRLGANVTVVEFLDRIVPAMDTEISKEFKKLLEKQRVKFKLSTKVISASATSKGVNLILEPATGGSQEKVNVDVVLVAIGRKAYTDKLGLEKIGIKVDERGRLQVNKQFETSIKGIYAIGDVIAGPMLAHKAEEEGVAVAEIIAGQHGHVNYDTIPGIVYTYPEVASVGKTEDELKNGGIEYKIGKFPFMANSRARTNGEAEGFVKIITDKKTDRILGAHIIGPNAGELIQELVLGMEYKASAEDIARTCHGHPGLSEAVKEAALGAYFKSIHI
jgi:dihydrolipoamide dehydrogenase